MLNEELQELERKVDEELAFLDIYRVPIIKINIPTLKAYFSQRGDLKLKIESGIIRREDLTERTYALFSKIGD